MARWVALNLIDPLIAYHTVNVMRTLAERMRSVAAPGAVQQRDSLEEFAQLWKSNREDTLIGALLHDSTAARVGALFQLLVQDTTAQDFGLPSSAIRLRM